MKYLGFGFSHKQTLRQGFECKEFIWTVNSGITGRAVGSETGKGRQPLQRVLGRGYAHEREAHPSGDLRDGDLQETHRLHVSVLPFEG